MLALSMTLRTTSGRVDAPAPYAARWSLLALALAAFFVHAAGARAIILPAVTIDGPSENIVGFGGVAMAEDGTGGVVYLKSVDGVPHVFVSRYVGEHWLAPMRVDTGMPYAASWPRIGAVERRRARGRVGDPVRVREAASPWTSCVSSMLGPGSAQFGPALIVDRDIREGTGTSPDLAMSSTGQADVVYRVVQEARAAPRSRCCVRTTCIEQVRVAHFNGERWTALGADQPRPRPLDAPAHGSERAEDRDRPDRCRASSSGRSRTSKAWRGSGPGASSDRTSTT